LITVGAEPHFGAGLVKFGPLSGPYGFWGPVVVGPIWGASNNDGDCWTRMSAVCGFGAILVSNNGGH
jgi:hypothetical protein